MRFLHTKLTSLSTALAIVLSLSWAPALAADSSAPAGEAAPLSTSETACFINIQSSQHGHITASPDPVHLLDTVTLTAIPDSGYKLDEIIATSSLERNIRLTAAGNNQYTFIMPAGTVTIKAFFIPQTISTEEISFADVSDSAWYADAVTYVASNGIMSGTGADTFSPDEPLTRAMTAQILYALEGKPNIGSINYGDVTYDDWYCNAVAWASDKWIMTGYGEGRFMPNNLITREQVALTLLNYANLHEYDIRAAGDLTAFSDGDSVSSWARQAMTWAVGAGILSAREDNLLEPGQPATRAEIAQSLMQLCQVVAK